MANERVFLSNTISFKNTGQRDVRLCKLTAVMLSANRYFRVALLSKVISDKYMFICWKEVSATRVLPFKDKIKHFSIQAACESRATLSTDSLIFLCNEIHLKVEEHYSVGEAIDRALFVSDNDQEFIGDFDQRE